MLIQTRSYSLRKESGETLVSVHEHTLCVQKSHAASAPPSEILMFTVVMWGGRTLERIAENGVK